MSPMYPQALWNPVTGHSAPGQLAWKNQLTLHATEGSTAAGAIQSSKDSVAPHRTSFHFVIDRDGKVYQCIALDETAWHASQVNMHAIGIEHVGISVNGAASLNRQYAKEIAAGTQKPFAYMPVLDVQIAASAKLVVWLCQLLKIPCDRAHIRTHNEASPADNHTECCTGALDPDRVVALAKTL